MARSPARTTPDTFLPLSEVAWEILLALAAEDRHGYAILREVERRTEGGLRLLPGSLYRTVHRLCGEGLVAEVGGDQQGRRRVFRLTTLGRQVAGAEARRLAEAMRVAAARGLLPGRERP